jgi:kynurenine formamidase/sugar lactone lactonase YvrE
MTHESRVRLTLAAGVLVMATSSRSPGDARLQATAQTTGSLSNPYQVVANHFKLPEGRTMGSTAAIDVDRDGRSVWVFERCGGPSPSQGLACPESKVDPVLKFDSSGRLVKSFGSGMFVSPHGIHVDRQGNIWLADGGVKNGKGDQVFKFSPDGKLLLTLGKAGVAGDGPDLFNPPSDILVAPNGDIFVADGHDASTNARIVKFSRDGKFLKTWGKLGTGPGEFNCPHSLAMDSAGRLFVADRLNNRIQIFDQDGKFLAEWRQFGRPSGIFIDRNDILYAADTQSDEQVNPGFKRGIRIGSAKDGKVTGLITDSDPDGIGEGVAADVDGNIFGALTAGRAVKKYARSTTANASSTPVTRADYDRWRTEFKTWGRWGADDNKGASNLITTQKVLAAVKLVKSGTVISLAANEPQQAAADVGANGVFKRTTNTTDVGTTDNYAVSYHGQTVSHIDSWCHFLEDGQMYNGLSAKDNISVDAGCRKGGVMNWKDGVFTRAVLYDMAQLKSVEWVEPGTPITRADLEAWEKRSGVKAGPGDVVLLYVGRWKRREKLGPWTGQVAGYYADTIPWLHDRMPAFVGHDMNIDWNPRPGWEGMRNPIHIAVLNWMGINIVENLDLERAVEFARRSRQYEFLVTFAPLPVEGGTGSPVNPLAIF